MSAASSGGPGSVLAPTGGDHQGSDRAVQAGGGVVDRATAAAAVSPKVTWAAAASALATLVWTLIASLAPAAFSGATVATLTGATATVLTFLGAYFARDPLRDH